MRYLYTSDQAVVGRVWELDIRLVYNSEEKANPCLGLSPPSPDCQFYYVLTASAYRDSVKS